MSKIFFISFLSVEEFCIRIQFLCLDRVITMYWIINLRFI
ncbi:hypothetical protein ERO13_D09G225600v2 [Gossypium hirsutum]|uniref:Uncharacterized protein n=3 Tax=Gossypium TaxID=3633 RepID=A0A5J5Q6N8_GOSBA|nr:hypothetical protein ES319_D09G244100v1 [Gossypium barbadense]KAG4131637.1 hypothetical protein ERO13_D09G225600v2 [Gossypium hirsutum]TYG55338.1 hypothetical protein ES288_D09G264800v1 [Gossypium darwinii]TYH55809.1 hypothetical protein ES332_D09G261500v1 [Gossypium tomentosum]